MKKIYLACPYSHPDQKMREWRVRQADKKAAELMSSGNLVFSPLSHSHPISKHCKVDPCDHDFWLRQDFWVLDICDVFYILALPGWGESFGIQQELIRAQKNGMEVTIDVEAQGKEKYEAPLVILQMRAHEQGRQAQGPPAVLV